MKMNLKPVFRYGMKNYLSGYGVFLAIMAVIMLCFMVAAGKAAVHVEGMSSFSGMGLISAVCVFVVGVASPREDIRLCLQLGVSRRTALAGIWLASSAAALALAAGGELLTLLGGWLCRGMENVFVMDLYQMIWLDGETMGPGGHVLSILVNTFVFLAAYAVGMFFSFGFWRLSRKLSIVAAALSIPLVLNGVPWLLYWLGVDLAPFEDWLLKSGFNAVITAAAAAAVFMAANARLLARAAIKEAAA